MPFLRHSLVSVVVSLQSCFPIFFVPKIIVIDPPDDDLLLLGHRLRVLLAARFKFQVLGGGRLALRAFAPLRDVWTRELVPDVLLRTTLMLRLSAKLFVYEAPPLLYLGLMHLLFLLPLGPSAKNLNCFGDGGRVLNQSLILKQLECFFLLLLCLFLEVLIDTFGHLLEGKQCLLLRL